MSSTDSIVLSDEELAVLANLAYLNSADSGPITDSVYNKIWDGTYENSDYSLGQILDEVVTPEMMNDLRSPANANTSDSHLTTGAEWYNIINEVKTNPNLRDLKLVDIDSYQTNGSRAFTVTSGNKTYIVFMGTGSSATGTEWPDNIGAISQSDTDAQIAALNYAKYINSRFGGDITVTGHSKGANKSMYATILAPFISRCVAFNGQGFSSDYLLRYASLLRDRSQLITSYSVDKDFVNPLLYNIAGTNHYVKGHGIEWVTGYPRNHSASSMMNFLDGSLGFVGSEQSRGAALINDFTLFLLDSVPDKYLDTVGSFLGDLIEAAFDGSGNKDIFAVIGGDPQGFGTLLACLASYPRSAELLQSIIGDAAPGFSVPLLTIIALLQAQSPGLIDNFFSRKTGELLLLAEIARLFGFDTEWIRQATLSFDEARASIGPGNGSLQSALGLDGKNEIVRDFTDAKKEELKAIINEINSEAWFDPTKWDIWYRAESWFGRLSIDNYQHNMNEYFRKTFDVNDTSAQDIDLIFTKARDADSKFSFEIKDVAENFTLAAKQLDTIFANAIGAKG